MSGMVVVGVDGSPSSLDAVEAAAWEAGRRGLGLRLAQALPWPAEPVPPGAPPWDPNGVGLHDGADAALAEAERRARRVAPQVEITREVLMGEPARVLQSESRFAALTVVGDGSAGPPRGSVAGQLTARCACPVLVVRGRVHRTGPVVLVGDASPATREAAEFAFAEASARGTDLVVLPTRGNDDRYAPTDLQKKYPDVTVRFRRLRHWARRALVDASADAQLVVIGARGRGRVADLLPGSVGRAVLRDGQCSVAVIPAGTV
ncbi:universal stress protein [Streptomyces blattellae]|uniref:universal stress protein n=1 Tax=Streptomyces blattellae TaxID=2569855 RepID=UPI0012B841A4|nr:universal stress protein [Streptomyces blattellae]